MNSVKVTFGITFLAMPNVYSLSGWLGGLFLYTLTIAIRSFTLKLTLDVFDKK
jgi:hypothetical protein